MLVTEEDQEFELEGGPERENRDFPQREIIDLASEYPDIFLRRAGRGEKKVALTFDDGPDEIYTVEILNILREHQVSATFFIIGKRAEMFPHVVRRMANEGHLVANHTWCHPDILEISQEELLKEVRNTDDIIQELAGYRPILFRPPYGSIDRERVELLGEMGYLIISWDVDSRDWTGISAREVQDNILSNTVEGSLILQHSAGGLGEELVGTVQALPEVIRTLREDGFEFVTIDQLLGIPYRT